MEDDDEQDTFGNSNGESEQQNAAGSEDAASNGHRSVPGTPMSVRSLAGSVAGTPQTPRLPFSAMSPFTPSSTARSAVPGSRDSTALPRSDLGMTPLRRRTFSTSSSVQRSQSSAVAAAAAGNTPSSQRSTPRKRARTGAGGGGGGGDGSDDGNNSDDASAPRFRGSPPNSPSPPGSPVSNGGAEISPPASPGANGHGGAAGGMDEAVIWGTDVNVNTAMENFRHFIRHFREEEPEVAEQVDSDDDDAQQQQQQQQRQPHYMALLSEIARSSVYSIEINCRHLFNHPRSRDLYGQLLRYPQEIVPIMDLVVHQEFCAVYGEDALQSARIQVLQHCYAQFLAWQIACTSIV
jgi:DNA replication licensing factor MCM4